MVRRETVASGCLGWEEFVKLGMSGQLRPVRLEMELEKLKMHKQPMNSHTVKFLNKNSTDDRFAAPSKIRRDMHQREIVKELNDNFKLWQAEHEPESFSFQVFHNDGTCVIGKSRGLLECEEYKFTRAGQLSQSDVNSYFLSYDSEEFT